MNHLRPSWRAAALVVMSLCSGCCWFCSCPMPGFVGVPEWIERSDDFQLPLDAARRTALVAFLSRGDRRVPRGWVPEDEDPGRVAELERRFQPLLDLLMQPVPDAMLGTRGAIAALADVPGRVLSVHDARVTELDLDPALASAIVRDGFVFAFHARRLVGTPAPQGTSWSLADAQPGVRTAVCVFRATFAVPHAAP